jgi:hypothetical protein
MTATIESFTLIPQEESQWITIPEFPDGAVYENSPSDEYSSCKQIVNQETAFRQRNTRVKQCTHL